MPPIRGARPARRPKIQGQSDNGLSVDFKVSGEQVAGTLQVRDAAGSVQSVSVTGMMVNGAFDVGGVHAQGYVFASGAIEPGGKTWRGSVWGDMPGAPKKSGKTRVSVDAKLTGRVVR
jgi:hypothetical protein